MKLTRLLPTIATALSLTASFSANAKDHHDRERERERDHDRHEHHDRDDDRRHISFHSSPFFYGRGYCAPSPYYYSRPSVSIGFYSRPATVYRGREVYGSYSDSLAADVQRELRRRGYYRGEIDGDIGPGSRAAIRYYQEDRGLYPTGRIDSSLLRSLGIG